MTFFLAEDSRSAIRAVLEERKKHGRKIPLADLADAIRVQRPYFSKFMRGKALLNSDQLFLLSRKLRLTEEQERFLQLLLERDRSALEERRRELTERISSLRSKALQIVETLSLPRADADPGALAEYYLEPDTLLVHMLLTIPKCARNPRIIPLVLAAPQARVDESLRILERLGLIRPEGQGYRVLQEHLHLPATSPICGPHQTLFRLRSMERLRNVAPDEHHSLVTAFTADPATLSRIRARLLAFLREVEEAVKPANPEGLYQLNIDLFPWL